MQTDTPAPSPAAPNSVDPRAVLQAMLDGLGLQTTVEQHDMDGTPLLHIATSEPGRLIGKGGQTLSQLQFLLNRILQRVDPAAPRVIVDCENYRDRQNEEITRRADEAADKVRRWGDEVRIGPFNAFERRTIHVHIQKDPELEAVSENEEEGGRKKMIIRLRAHRPPT
jgi:spoIIIJ-associated protein